jgi:hypothetical protein
VCGREGEGGGDATRREKRERRKIGEDGEEKASSKEILTALPCHWG